MLNSKYLLTLNPIGNETVITILKEVDGNRNIDEISKNI